MRVKKRRKHAARFHWWNRRKRVQPMVVPELSVVDMVGL
jgi:hypothetical protein